MAQTEDQFLAELENKLEQNRRIAQQSWLPKPLYGVASYLGFHSLRVLVIVSFLLTVLVFWREYELMVEWSKKLFLFL